MMNHVDRTLIAVTRKVLSSGLVLLIVWFGLWGLRGAISPAVVDLVIARMPFIPPLGFNPRISYNTRSWDWSRSLWTHRPVAEMIGARLSVTLGIMAWGALVGLGISALLLFVGMLISRTTERPRWLRRTGQVLRIVLVNAGASTPYYVIGALLVTYVVLGFTGWPPLSAALLTAWLLVQYGHGELANWPGRPSVLDKALWGHLGARLLIRMLRLVGAIAVITIFVEQTTGQAGLGTLFIQAVKQSNLPLVFGIAWTFVVIVVIVKLVADLLEIACNHLHQPLAQTATRERAGRLRPPKWATMTCFALIGVSLVAAVSAPLIAPRGYNQIDWSARIAPPSAAHIMGMDRLGRDVFGRIITGMRQDVLLGLAAAGIVFLVATGWATLWAHVRRRRDWKGDVLADLIMLPRAVLCAFPWLVLMLFVQDVMVPYSPIALLAGVVLLPRAAGMMQEAYVSHPADRTWTWPRRLLSAGPPVLAFAIAAGILYIAAAGYLGLGVPAPTPELGDMLNGAARQYWGSAPWTALWPSLVLMLLLLVWEMAGDALLERFGFRSKAVWSKVWE